MGENLLEQSLSIIQFKRKFLTQPHENYYKKTQ